MATNEQFARFRKPEPALITGTGSILLCEDDREVSQFVVAALEEAGYEVIETRSGAAALSVLDHRPDIKLLLLWRPPRAAPPRSPAAL